MATSPITTALTKIRPNPSLIRFASQSPAPQVHSKNKIMLVVNPQAGGVGDSPLDQQIQDELNTFRPKDKDRFMVVKATSNPADLQTLIAQHKDKLNTVVAIGGDGSIRQVIKALLPLKDPSIAVGVLPRGTGNLFATELGIPTSLKEGLQTLLTGKRFESDILMANGKEPCIMMGGAGLDADIMEATTRTEKRWFGKLAYVKSVLTQLFSSPIVTFNIETDDGKLIRKKGIAVLVANAGKLLGPFSFTPDAKPNDGLLDVAILGMQNRMDYLKIGYQLLTSSPQKLMKKVLDGVTHFKAKKVTITSDQAVRTEVDGDVIGKTPVEFTVVPKAVSFIIPHHANPFPKNNVTTLKPATSESLPT